MTMPPIAPDAEPTDSPGWNLAVIDACADRSLPALLLADPDHAMSLYRLPTDDEYHQVAPFLINWPPQWWSQFSGGAKADWGILLDAPDDRNAILDHLRRFLSVKAPDGDIWLFRYYDPRVLGPFLQACSAGELTRFFGPVRRVGCPNQAGHLDVFRRDAIGSSVGVAGRVRMSQVHTTMPDGPLFQLRAPHLEAFTEPAEAALVERIRAQLDSDVLEGASDEVINARIRVGLDRARSRYGIDGEDALTTFVAFMWEIGPGFDREPQIQQLLTAGRGDADTRVLELADRASATAWDDAMELSKPKDWLESRGVPQ